MVFSFCILLCGCSILEQTVNGIAKVAHGIIQVEKLTSAFRLLIPPEYRPGADLALHVADLFLTGFTETENSQMIDEMREHIRQGVEEGRILSREDLLVIIGKQQKHLQELYRQRGETPPETILSFNQNQEGVTDKKEGEQINESDMPKDMTLEQQLIWIDFENVRQERIAELMRQTLIEEKNRLEVLRDKNNDMSTQSQYFKQKIKKLEEKIKALESLKNNDDRSE